MKAYKTSGIVFSAKPTLSSRFIGSGFVLAMFLIVPLSPLGSSWIILIGWGFLCLFFLLDLWLVRLSLKLDRVAYRNIIGRTRYVCFSEISVIAHKNAEKTIIYADDSKAIVFPSRIDGMQEFVRQLVFEVRKIRPVLVFGVDEDDSVVVRPSGHDDVEKVVGSEAKNKRRVGRR